tara:strand:- start:3407 stop:4258 length:852 start_codon:yes stop_codon:yes gene_type:complete
VSKILITGSTGFVGSEIVSKLSKNNKIYIILRKKRKLNFKNKKIYKIYFKNFEDLNRKLKKIKVDSVIHCATHYIKKHEFDDIQKLCESNILYGNVILENIKKMNVKKFINFSTVWENYDGIKNNYFNLYSVYKKNFTNIINYYSNIYKDINFFNLIISDTFGEKDKRKKLINILKENYKKDMPTKILSKRLHINLLNVKDISNAVGILLNKKILPGRYVLKNKQTFSVLDIVNKLNATSEKKIKIKWLSNKLIREKIYNYRLLPGWEPNSSKIRDIVELIRK